MDGIICRLFLIFGWVVGYLFRGALCGVRFGRRHLMQYKGVIMSKIFNNVPAGCVRQWTPLAIQCYKSGCACYKCKIIENLKTITPENCNMKAVVFQLVRKFGKPNTVRGIE